MDGQPQIKVYTVERTRVHSAQSSLVVTQVITGGGGGARRYLTSVTESPSKHWSPPRTFRWQGVRRRTVFYNHRVPALHLFIHLSLWLLSLSLLLLTLLLLFQRHKSKCISPTMCCVLSYNRALVYTAVGITAGLTSIKQAPGLHYSHSRLLLPAPRLSLHLAPHWRGHS